jgi:glycine/D-amino acid oxidase-like deaminating enzyme
MPRRPIEEHAVKDTPYWIDTAPAFPDRSGRPLPETVDVAIVGGGITGLNAATRLAQKGAVVAVFEKGRFGSGASGRNGGMCTTGVAVGAKAAVDRYGVAAAVEYHDAYLKAVDFVEQLVRTEGIDCDFRRAGRLGVASRPSHHEHQKATHTLLAQQFHHETMLIGPSELRTELGSDYYCGALLDPLSAGLHAGRYLHGLVDVAERSGARLHDMTPVTAVRQRRDGRYDVAASSGSISAAQVLLATDAYTDGVFPRLRRRMVTVGSFIRDMRSVFPQLSGVRVEYVWGGNVGISFDRMPHAGQIGGLYYSMGYSGHGVQMASLMGARMAEVMDGHPEANPWRGLRARAFPTYSGTAWFLPFVGAYFRLKDRLGMAH